MAVRKKKRSVSKKRAAKKKITPKKKPLKKRSLKITKPKKRRAEAKKIKQAIIGTVTHYFPKVRAAVIKLKVPLSIGESIKIKGHTTDFTQTVTSMQIDRVPITQAKKGEEIGLLVNSRVRGSDIVYKP